MNRELLEVRNVNLPALGRIQIRLSGPHKRPLDHGMRDVLTIREGSVAPLSVVSA
jgi:hypothetical protein